MSDALPDASASSSAFQGSGPGPRARPVMRAGPWSWLFRASGIAAFVAALTGVLIAPGLRGLARDGVVELANRTAWTFAYFAVGLLTIGIVIGVRSLGRSGRVRPGWGLFMMIGGLLVVTLVSPAIMYPLGPVRASVLAVATSILALGAGLQGLRASHTRAVAVVMVSFALAGLVRVFAWNLAGAAGDVGNMKLYNLARGVATAGLLLEALGQAMAAAWLGTRSRFLGQILSTVAVGVATLMMFEASYGASVSAGPWQVAAHLALATAPGLPQPYGPTGLAVFLLAGSIMLAGVAAIQRAQVEAVVAALALMLLSRGGFDIPMHALAAGAAAVWLMIATTDERSVWQALLARPRDQAPRPKEPAAARGR